MFVSGSISDQGRELRVDLNFWRFSDADRGLLAVGEVVDSVAELCSFSGDGKES